MAVTASGLYLPTWIDILDTTQLAVDLDAETHKIALFTNAITPNFSTDTAYGVGAYSANEVSGTGYTAGGATLTSTTVTENPTGTLMWDAADVAWASSTITNARAGLIYADALAGNNALVLVNFAADYSTVAGTFTIQWAAGGIMNIDLTPDPVPQHVTLSGPSGMVAPTAPMAVGTVVGVPTGTTLTTTADLSAPDASGWSVTLTDPDTGASSTRATYRRFVGRRFVGDLVITGTTPVLLENCRVEGRVDVGTPGGGTFMEPKLVMVRCTIDGSDLAGSNLVEGDAWVVDSHGTGAEDGWTGITNGAVIRSQFLATTDSQPDPHSDGVQVAYGGDVLLWASFFDAGDPSASSNAPVRIGNEFGPVNNVRILHCGLAGTQHGLQVRGDSARTPPLGPATPGAITGIRVEGCRFEAGTAYGPHNFNGLAPAQVTWSGNEFIGGGVVAAPVFGVGDWVSSTPSFVA